MLYQLLFSLHDQVSWLSWLNVLRYTSTRIIASTMTALLLSLILYPWFIRTLQRIQLGQVVRDDGPESHFSKRGTPTMGGSLILFCLIIPTVAWSDMNNPFVVLATLVTAGTGVIGFIDDAMKVKRKSSGGMPGKVKFLLQILISALTCWFLFDFQLADVFDSCSWWMTQKCSVAPAADVSGVIPANIRYRLAFPLISFYERAPYLPMAIYFGFAVFVIVAFSNAVNLTDGLDGLAIGPVIFTSGTFLLLTYLAGTLIAGFDIARYLNIAHIPGVGELSIYCGALVGAGVGFLWYNTFPASVFMGDVGSLPLGAGLGFLAVASKNEFTLVIVGGIFVLETVSVVVQVVSFKLTGKRVFRMAPIHHHFELKGWSEPKVVVRFWIISFVLALIGLATLKLR